MRLAAALIVMMVLMSGCISWPFGETHRTGFKEGDLTLPSYYSYSTPLTNKPDAGLHSQPGYKYNISWELGRVYVNYGGAARITTENTGTNNIFVYNYGIKMGSSKWKWTDSGEGVTIKNGEEKKFYMSFGAPSNPGKYSYRLSCSFMVNNIASSLPFPKNRWYDNGTAYFQESNVNVKAYNSSSAYSLSKNYYYYFDKINDMVKPFDLTIYQKAREITLPFSGNYNIFQVCSIFDYLLDNLSYIEDPEGKDVWSDPLTTLSRGGGDCEDYAMLFSALVSSIGGTTRIYLTDNHAFATVYIGKGAQSNEIMDEIDKYYGTNLYFATIEDDLGYWLVADPLASFYLGGLPVGGDTVGPPAADNLYNWDFTETGHVNAVDVMRK